MTSMLLISEGLQNAKNTPDTNELFEHVVAAEENYGDE